MARMLWFLVCIGLLLGSLLLAWPFLARVISPSPPIEQGRMDVYFCPKDDCAAAMVAAITSAARVHCAFYDLRLETVKDVLMEKDAAVLIDEDYFADAAYPGATLIRQEGLMHNKFCVLDDTVITGSFNPTPNDNVSNNNNLLIISSPTLAKNYLDEWYELKEGGRKRTRMTSWTFNKYTLENYFCPDDGCRERLLQAIASAKHNISFLYFTFTDDDVGTAIADKAETIIVRGVVEKTQAGSSFSEYARVQEAGADVLLDTNRKFMHHKVMIIDEEMVVTGSYNPTQAGTTINAENVLVIRDPVIVEQFVEEFESIYASATT